MGRTGLVKISSRFGQREDGQVKIYRVACTGASPFYKQTSRLSEIVELQYLSPLLPSPLTPSPLTP